jgi:hypothetical protein
MSRVQEYSRERAQEEYLEEEQVQRKVAGGSSWDVAGGTFTGTVRRNFHEKGTRRNKVSVY